MPIVPYICVTPPSPALRPSSAFDCTHENTDEPELESEDWDHDCADDDDDDELEDMEASVCMVVGVAFREDAYVIAYRGCSPYT
jgi:hypothetical protein